MTEDSERRADIVVAANMLPYLVSLIESASYWGVQHNAIKILNSVAQDNEAHLQAVVAVNPVARLLKVWLQFINICRICHDGCVQWFVAHE